MATHNCMRYLHYRFECKNQRICNYNMKQCLRCGWCFCCCCGCIMYTCSQKQKILREQIEKAPMSQFLTKIPNNIEIPNDNNNEAYRNVNKDEEVKPLGVYIELKSPDIDTEIESFDKDMKVKSLDVDTEVKIPDVDMVIESFDKDTEVKSLNVDMVVKLLDEDTDVKIPDVDRVIESFDKDAEVKSLNVDMVVKLLNEDADVKFSDVNTKMESLDIDIEVKSLDVNTKVEPLIQDDNMGLTQNDIITREQNFTTNDSKNILKQSKIEAHSFREATCIENGDQGKQCGLLNYRKWWELVEVDISVYGKLITGVPIFIEENTIRVVNNKHSYFISLEKVDYIRTSDGLGCCCQSSGGK